MKVLCSNCNKEIKLDTKTLSFISNAEKKNRSFIMLPCDKCGLDFSYNPQNKNNVFEKELIWRCPTSGCHGYVSFISDYADKAFYGCSETGDIWYKKEDFYTDIKNIIKKYSYRKNCYICQNNEWLPKDCDIDNLIDKEEDKRWE
jgi:hypothetical protein